MTSQFTFSSISHKTATSREIGSNAPPKRVGVNSATVACSCGHTWPARSGSGLDGVLGGILVTCPSCRASELVNGREFDI